MTSYAFPFAGHLPPKDAETGGDLAVWFEREPSAAERRRIAKGRPRTLRAPTWHGRWCDCSSDIDAITADLDAYVTEQDAWLHAAHEVIPIAFAMGPWPHHVDAWGEWSRDALVEAAAREFRREHDEGKATIDLAHLQLQVLAFAQAAGTSPATSAYQRVLGAVPIRDGGPLLQLQFAIPEPALTELVATLAPTTQLLFYGHASIGPPRLVAMDEPVAFVTSIFEACDPADRVWAIQLLSVLAHNLSLLRHKPEPPAPLRHAVALLEHALAAHPDPSPRDRADLTKLQKKLARKLSK